ncbi:MAG TPA: hypothetical protein VFA18_12945, partial [Gemmataceae bacterium]|nr:hypothetical protein [Gemmataceae bacterium]
MASSFRRIKRKLLAVALVALATTLARAEEKTTRADLAAQLRTWNANVLATDDAQAKQLSRLLADDARARLQAANRRES